MRVRVFGTLRRVVGAKEVEVGLDPGDTVRDVLTKIIAEYPAMGEKLLDDDGRLQGSVHVLINGRSIRYLEGLDSITQEGDLFALFPAVGGG